MIPALMKMNMNSICTLILLIGLPSTTSFNGPTKRPNPTITDTTPIILPGSGKYVYHLTDYNFTKAAVADLTGEGPLFIEFYTKWCGHCKELAPTWKTLAAELRGRVRVAAMDISENPMTMGQLGVTAFPTLVYIQRNRVYTYDTGRARSLGALKKFALGGFNEMNWDGLQQPPQNTQPSSKSLSLSTVLHRLRRIIQVCLFFWTRATMPSIITFFVGAVFGIIATLITTKAAGNRHLAELEDELIDRLNELEDTQKQQQQQQQIATSSKKPSGNSNSKASASTSRDKKKV